MAVAALLEAVGAARAVEHPVDRVTLQADAAEALWKLDEAAARAVFRRAWQFTTDPGALSAFEPGPDEEGARLGARERILGARDHIIRRAARHDPELAEGFMQEFKRGLPAEEDEAEAAAASAGGPRPASALNAQRLLTADALLDEGAVESAVATAAPAFAEGVDSLALRFLLRLRARDAARADALYLRLLDATRADPSAGATQALLLSTPVVSPELIALVAPDGSVHFQTVNPRAQDPREAAPVPPRVRRAFFDTAAALLTRPSAPGAAEPTGASLANYFAIGRLLPFFEREAPQHAAVLRARAAGLAQEIGEARRESVSSSMHVRKLRPENPTDPLRWQLDALARAADDAGRDQARFEAVSAAALRKLWARGRQLAGEIGDPVTRRAAFLMLSAEQVKSLGEAFRDEEAGDDYERAAAFARGTDVPAGMRAHGLAQAAELAAQKGKKRRAAELFAEAAGLAAQADRGTELRVALFSLLTRAAARLGDARAWELLAELASAVNELEARPVSEEEPDECPGVRVETAVNSYCVELATPLPGPEETFGVMARLDLGRALAEARTLKGDFTRAAALIAAARAATARPASAAAAR
ncbi:MAG TPA: hypothetical protein VG148_12610 [Pyrinomonadaceae bacterium]|nr:hypothetical protein [Pyrinomonadaceae bacterium]